MPALRYNCSLHAKARHVDRIMLIEQSAIGAWLGHWYHDDDFTWGERRRFLEGARIAANHADDKFGLRADATQLLSVLFEGR